MASILKIILPCLLGFLHGRVISARCSDAKDADKLGTIRNNNINKQNWKFEPPNDELVRLQLNLTTTIKCKGGKPKFEINGDKRCKNHKGVYTYHESCGEDLCDDRDKCEETKFPLCVEYDRKNKDGDFTIEYEFKPCSAATTQQSGPTTFPQTSLARVPDAGTTQISWASKRANHTLTTTPNTNDTTLAIVIPVIVIVLLVAIGIIGIFLKMRANRAKTTERVEAVYNQLAARQSGTELASLPKVPESSNDNQYEDVGEETVLQNGGCNNDYDKLDLEKLVNQNGKESSNSNYESFHSSGKSEVVDNILYEPA